MMGFAQKATSFAVDETLRFCPHRSRKLFGASGNVSKSSGVLAALVLLGSSLWFGRCLRKLLSLFKVQFDSNGKTIRTKITDKMELGWWVHKRIFFHSFSLFWTFFERRYSEKREQAGIRHTRSAFKQPLSSWFPPTFIYSLMPHPTNARNRILLAVKQIHHKQFDICVHACELIGHCIAICYGNVSVVEQRHVETMTANPQMFSLGKSPINFSAYFAASRRISHCAWKQCLTIKSWLLRFEQGIWKTKRGGSSLFQLEKN